MKNLDKKSLAALFGAVALTAGCGGGGAGASAPPAPVPAASAPASGSPPPAPLPHVITADEVTGAGTDRIVGLALDSTMTLVHAALLVNRLPEALAKLPAGQSALQENCAAPLPPLIANSSGTSIQLDNAGGGLGSTSRIALTQTSCADWGLSHWNLKGHAQLFSQQVAGDPKSALSDWTVASQAPGSAWSVMLDAHSGVAAGDRVHSVNGNPRGTLRQSGGKREVRIDPPAAGATFEAKTYRYLDAQFTRTEIAGRALSVVGTNPILVESSLGQSGIAVNPSADGWFVITETPMAWMQKASLPNRLGSQGGQVEVKNLRFSSLAQANARRADSGELTIRPNVRYGYVIQVSVLNATQLRVRVLDVNGGIASDRTVAWESALWSYTMANP